MSILIFGKNGQLARALKRSLTARGQVHSCHGKDEFNLLTETRNIAGFIRHHAPKAVINASGFTNVDGAEQREADANRLNAKAPGMMALACKAANIPFIHVSTDYVFDGAKSGLYDPADKRAPLNAYGRSKAAGERAVIAADGRSVILRTSWVYDAEGKNFFTTMLHLAKTETQLNLVSTQFGRPTYAGHLAEACLAALEGIPSKPMIHHVSNSGPVISWADFAEAIFKRAKIVPDIERVGEAHFPRPAKRPVNSALDISAFERDFNYLLEPWQTGLELAFQDMER
ncbi:dTDP-4-dehydrorhamnose reductase [Hellea balneolensis]|uniref:dTDP-4-dehydrorhamnose reductase n=1 Tax=Hellea balneolensis TaxID=287478 RepID=UPI0004068CC2|nr:dTDP-4-dehydrorhamnose reductase [Hellea balneolensis]